MKAGPRGERIGGALVNKSMRAVRLWLDGMELRGLCELEYNRASLCRLGKWGSDVGNY